MLHEEIPQTSDWSKKNISDVSQHHYHGTQQWGHWMMHCTKIKKLRNMRTEGKKI
jgi:hypothetical protein